MTTPNEALRTILSGRQRDFGPQSAWARLQYKSRVMICSYADGRVVSADGRKPALEVSDSAGQGGSDPCDFGVSVRYFARC